MDAGCSRRSALKVIAAGAAGTLLHAQDTHDDTIALDTEYQTIENFGASDCWSMQKLGTWSMPARNRVADLLFSQSAGIGLSCWRFNIGGGTTDRITNPWRTVETFEVGEGQYDWTRQAPERWFLGAAKARGVAQFLAFVNSPPGRMTRTGITFGQPGGDTTNLKPGFEAQFARYLVDILEHFRDNPDRSERVAFDYVSPINEPNDFSLGQHRWRLRSITPYVTSDRNGDELRQHPDIPPGRTIEIPPRSVTTLIAAFN
jgi:O-glycosyl hydrolase